MEDGICENIGCSTKCNRVENLPSISRPGSMVMMTITVQEYETEYWPKLEGAINQLLTMSPGHYSPISYEQMYSCVYKCVCKRYSERLFSDLLQQITQHLEKMSLMFMIEDSTRYIETFHHALNQYLQALAGIVAIFNYMNQHYVESKLKKDLSFELKNLFIQIVAERHIAKLIPLLVDANSKSFSVPPEIMSNLIRNLYNLKPDYAKLRPNLFARYIPNVLEPCRIEDLDKYIAETKQLQRDLNNHPEFISGDQSRKRLIDDESTRIGSFCIHGLNT